MISDDTIRLAIDEGVVSPDQAERLRALEKTRAAAPAEPQDDEKLRFISGFGDIFVTIGLALFLGASGYFLSTFGPVATGAGLAVLAWALAEFFTRVRRMALPSIVLLMVFAAAVFFTVAQATGGGDAGQRYGLATAWLGIDFGRLGPQVAAPFATLVGAALHYIRFRVPITVAAGVAALGGMLVGTAYALAPGVVTAFIEPLILVIGVAVFALAMRFDRADPMRRSRRTDIAFWLHLLAAPLIVHPLVSGFLVGRAPQDVAAALAVLGVFLALGFVAILVDRRAMLVSGLVYAGIAFASLLDRSGIAETTAPATMLALGAFVLLLSAGWRPLRTAILRAMPDTVARRLPPPSASSA